MNMPKTKEEILLEIEKNKKFLEDKGGTLAVSMLEALSKTFTAYIDIMRQDEPVSNFEKTQIMLGAMLSVEDAYGVGAVFSLLMEYFVTNKFDEMMAGKFEVYKDAKGEFRFRLKAGNGEVIATGEGYSSKSGCMNGIESIKKNAVDAEIVELND